MIIILLKVLTLFLQNDEIGKEIIKEIKKRYFSIKVERDEGSEQLVDQIILELDNDFLGYFKKLLQTDSLEELAKEPRPTKGHERLFAARKFFEDCFTKLYKDEKDRSPSTADTRFQKFLHNFYKAVNEKLLFITHIIKTEADECKIFETANNSGKPLYHMEKIRSFLIDLSSKYNLNLENEIGNCWSKIFRIKKKGELVCHEEDKLFGEFWKKTLIYTFRKSLDCSWKTIHKQRWIIC